MTIFKLFVGLDPLVEMACIEKSRCLSLIIVYWQNRVHSKHTIETASRQIFAILADSNHPDRLVTHLEVVQMLEIEEVLVGLLVRTRLEPDNLRFHSELVA